MDEYRTSYKRLREWGFMTVSQRVQVQRSKDEIQAPDELEPSSTARRKRRRISTTNEQITTTGGVARFTPKENDPPSSFTSRANSFAASSMIGQLVHYQSPLFSGTAKIADIDITADSETYLLSFGSNGRLIQANGMSLSKLETLPAQQHETATMSSDPVDPTPPCRGLTYSYLCLRSQNVHNLEDGYRRVVGDSQHLKATAIAHCLPWPVDPTVYSGCIDDNITNQVRLLFRQEQGDGADGFLYKRGGFVSVECSGVSDANKNGPCKGCLKQEKFLRRKCMREAGWSVDVDPNSLSGIRVDYEESPTKLRGHCRARATKKDVDMKRQRRATERAIQDIRDSEPQDLSESLKKQLGIKHVAELFSNKEIKRMWEETLKDETVERKQLAHALWNESLNNALMARSNGSFLARYSDPMMQMAIQMKIKLGCGRYAFVSKALPGLPSLRQVQRKMASNSTASSSVNGGILYASLSDMQETFDTVYGNDVPLEDSRRATSLGWDSTTIVSGLEKSRTTNETVGLAYDSCEGTTVFKAALESMAEIDSQDDEQGGAATSNVEMAEHFLVFIATTLDKNHDPVKRTVARYALKSVNVEFLDRHVDRLISVLLNFGFLVVATAMDGATENRSWAKLKATHSLEDLMEAGVCPSDLKQDPLIPTKKKVAFLHPCFDPGLNVFVVIHPDMPHLIKKIVNALEMSSDPQSSRDMHFQGMPLSLQMVESMWERSGGRIGVVRTSKHSTDHFDKNANNRMLSFLAFQITSASSVAMIREVLERDSDDDERKLYEPLLKFLALLDRVIDVMNAKKSGFDSGIDSCSHRDLKDLLDPVRFVEEWRLEIKSNDDLDMNVNFLPMTTYEDLVWMSIGTYVLANRYCERGVPFSIDLGRCGTDCCEYRFGNLKGRYTARLTIANANQGTYLADNMNASAFNLRACGNTCGAALTTEQFRNKRR